MDMPISTQSDQGQVKEAPNFRDQRRERIIQVARSVFFEVGYAGASMSLISSRLGGSKATLYAYFNSKEELFEAIIREQCQSMDALFKAHIGTRDLRQSLTQVGREMMGAMLSDWGNRTVQLVIEESHRNPELARIFYSVITSRTRTSFLALLQSAHDDGLIHAPNAQEAVGILKSLLFGEIHFKRLLNLDPAPDAEVLNQHIDRSVDIFMTYYGRDKVAGVTT